MTFNLEIAVEAQWRGGVLETLRPLARLPLRETPELPGLLTIGESFALHLSNGEQVKVWCARTSIGRFTIVLSNEVRSLLRTESNAPISANVDLSDGKQYQFSIRVGA